MTSADPLGIPDSPSRPAEVGRNDRRNYSAAVHKKFALPKTVAPPLSAVDAFDAPARSPGRAGRAARPAPQVPAEHERTTPIGVRMNHPVVMHAGPDENPS